ncbi:MAG: CRTAC1 family protein, partial [Gammaproteobacteria bacterium]|nr:CRTAC1 family protein [Gammaproteobacteria bacterium]
MIKRKRQSRIVLKATHSISTFAAVLLAMFWGPEALAQACNAMNFSDVTLSSGITHSYNRPSTPAGVMTGGAVAEDFNNDGWLDLYVVQGSGGPNLLYINDQAGGFTDEAAARSADLQLASVAASAADFDNDGDIDIGVSVAEDQFRILVNDGTGNFTSEIVLPLALKSTMSSSWGDVDNDGFLELAIGQWNEGEQSFFLYRNLGGTNLSEYEFRVTPRDDIYVFSPRFADLNGDRLADLHVVSDFTNSQLYMNVGGGSFQNVTSTNGTGGVTGGQNEMGHSIADYDSDGDLDIFTSNISTDGGNRLYQNDGTGVFSGVQNASGVLDGHWGWGASFGDLDNDSDLDLYHVNGWHTGAIYIDTPARLFMNDGSGTFSEVADCAGAGDRGQGKGMLQFDYDNDGDLDIFIVNNMDVPAVGQEFPGNPVLLRNDTSNGNRWLKVTLDGAPPLHRNGIGSRVFVRVGATTMLHEMHASTNFLSQNAGRIAHFGLGSAATANEVTAEWVTGDATIIPNVAANQQVAIPSPVATVSSRVINLNESVTGDASPEPMPVDWDVDGTTHADPVTVSFDTGGVKNLTLNVYDASGSTVVRQEVIRVTVLAPEITSPVPGSVLASDAVTFNWTENSAAVIDWRLQVGTSTGDDSLHDSGTLAASQLTELVSGLPTDGSTVFVRLSYTIGSTTEFIDYTYTTSNVASGPAIVNPSPGSALPGSSVTFDFVDNGEGSTFWQLWLGTTAGTNDLGDSGIINSAVTSTTLSGLPTDGTTIYATLYWVVGQVGVDPTQSSSFTYTAADIPTIDPEISNPSPGSTLAGSSATFDFAENGSGATFWQLWLGSTAGANDLGDSGIMNSAITSTTLSGLPTDGTTIYATLYWVVGQVGVDPTRSSSFTYSAASVVGTPALTTPVPGSVLTSDSVTFRWTSSAVPVTDWRLQVGTSVGDGSLHDSGTLGAAVLLQAVNGLPTDGSTVYVRLSYTVAAVTQFIDYTYIAMTAGAGPTIANPAPGSTLAGASATFNFADNGAGSTFWQLWLGSTAGANDLGDSGVINSAVTSTTISGLPTDGSTVHATLYWVVGQVGVDPT